MENKLKSTLVATDRKRTSSLSTTTKRSLQWNGGNLKSSEVSKRQKSGEILMLFCLKR